MGKTLRCRYRNRNSLTRCHRGTTNPPYCSTHRWLVIFKSRDLKKQKIKSPSSTTATCPICLESKEVIPFSCDHQFCLSCRDRLRNVTCPLCRTFVGCEFTADELAAIVQRMVSDRVSVEVAGLRQQLEAINNETNNEELEEAEARYNHLLDLYNRSLRNNEDLRNYLRTYI